MEPQDLWDCNIIFNNYVVGVLEDKAGFERVFKEVIAKILPNLVKDLNLQIQEAKQDKFKEVHSKIYHGLSIWHTFVENMLCARYWIYKDEQNIASALKKLNV